MNVFSSFILTCCKPVTYYPQHRYNNSQHIIMPLKWQRSVRSVNNNAVKAAVLVLCWTACVQHIDDVLFVHTGRHEGAAELSVTFHECMHRHVGEVQW